MFCRKCFAENVLQKMFCKNVLQKMFCIMFCKKVLQESLHINVLQKVLQKMFCRKCFAENVLQKCFAEKVLQKMFCIMFCKKVLQESLCKNVLQKVLQNVLQRFLSHKGVFLRRSFSFSHFQEGSFSNTKLKNTSSLLVLHYQYPQQCGDRSHQVDDQEYLWPRPENAKGCSLCFLREINRTNFLRQYVYLQTALPSVCGENAFTPLLFIPYFKLFIHSAILHTQFIHTIHLVF